MPGTSRAWTAVAQRVGQLQIVEHNVVVIRTNMLHHVADKVAVGIRLEKAFLKIARIVHIVHRIGRERFAAFAGSFGRHSR